MMQLREDVHQSVLCKGRGSCIGAFDGEGKRAARNVSRLFSSERSLPSMVAMHMSGRQRETQRGRVQSKLWKVCRNMCFVVQTALAPALR